MNKLWFLGGFFALALVLSVFVVVSAAGPSQQPAAVQLAAGNTNTVGAATTCGCGADSPCGGNCGAQGKTCQCGGACRMNQNQAQ